MRTFCILSCAHLWTCVIPWILLRNSFYSNHVILQSSPIPTQKSASLQALCLALCITPDIIKIITFWVNHLLRFNIRNLGVISAEACWTRWGKKLQRNWKQGLYLFNHLPVLEEAAACKPSDFEILTLASVVIINQWHVTGQYTRHDCKSGWYTDSFSFNCIASMLIQKGCFSDLCRKQIKKKRKS